MNTLIIDSSVAAKLLIEEPGTSAAEAVLSTGSSRLLAPELLPLELANVVWKRVQRGELSVGQAEAAFAGIVKIPVALAPIMPLLAPAFQIAISTGRTVYDALYIAAAMSNDGVLITADRKLVNALKQRGLGKYVKELDIDAVG